MNILTYLNNAVGLELADELLDVGDLLASDARRRLLDCDGLEARLDVDAELFGGELRDRHLASLERPLVESSMRMEVEKVKTFDLCGRTPTKLTASKSLQCTF